MKITFYARMFEIYKFLNGEYTVVLVDTYMHGSYTTKIEIDPDKFEITPFEDRYERNKWSWQIKRKV